MKLKWFFQLAGIMLLSLVLRNPLTQLKYTFFYIFQERDILRAQELLNGFPIFFGPEMTGGGFLPGPFYYYLLTPPLWLGLGWEGVWSWMFFLLSLGGAIGWAYIYKKLDTITAFLWLVLYSVGVTTTQISLGFVNPSFSFVFIIIINVLLLQAFTESSLQKRNRALIWTCFIIGLAIQLHYSILVYIFTVIFLQFSAKRLKLVQPEFKALIAGLGVFLLSVSPYLLWRTFKIFGIEFGQEAWLGGDMVNSLPSLIVHFKTALSVSMSDFISGSFKKLFLIVPIATLLLGITIRFIPEKSSSVDDTKSNSMLKIMLVCMFFTFIPFFFYFFVPQGSRYGAPLTITLSFLTAILFHRQLSLKTGLRYFNGVGFLILIISVGGLFLIDPVVLDQEGAKVCVAMAFLAVAYLAFRLMDKKNSAVMILGFVICSGLFITQSLHQNNFRKQLHRDGNLPQYWHWQKIISKIYNQTRWNYQEMTERIYFVNHHIEQAPLLAFDLFANDIPEFALNPPIKPDGYLISVADHRADKDLDWILRQILHDDLRAGLTSGDILLGDYDSNDTVMIAPYFIKNKLAHPLHYSNLGLGYRRLNEEKLLRDLDFQVGVKRESDNRFIFKWNECPTHHYYCDTGVIAEVTKTSEGIYEFSLKIVGMSLSQSSSWIAPDWTQAWILPYLEVRCDGKNTKYPIISSIGFQNKYMRPDDVFKYLFTNNSLLAPLQRNFRIKCLQGLTEFSVGREASEVEQSINFFKLPPTKITTQF